jgi:Pyruvate/2-oxoacid:ferredoxin oxidoreductase delta subunit
MKYYLNHNEIIKLKNEINRDKENIKLLRLQIKKLEETIKCKETRLLNYCEHEKVIDRSYQDEHTQYYCKICGINL